MNWSIVNDERRGTSQLLAEIVDARDHDCRIDSPFGDVGVKMRPIVLHETQHV